MVESVYLKYFLIMYIKNYIKIQFEGVQIDLMKIFVEKQNTVKKKQ